jgi:hypothetical protein
VINVSDSNLGDIFPQEHVEFIDRLKSARKRSADDDNIDDEDCSFLCLLDTRINAHLTSLSICTSVRVIGTFLNRHACGI